MQYHTLGFYVSYKKCSEFSSLSKNPKVHRKLLIPVPVSGTPNIFMMDVNQSEPLTEVCLALRSGQHMYASFGRIRLKPGRVLMSITKSQVCVCLFVRLLCVRVHECVSTKLMYER